VIPDAHRYGTPILVCADGARATKAWLAHLRDQHGLDLRFSVGFTMTGAVQTARSWRSPSRRGPQRLRPTAVSASG